ncbi:neuropeptide Y receptor [Anopheles darlingi]|uniref:Neuropeptide Y receptor n=1 Tax=Anopheles darlingi TaxID=43151 RepID=W5JI13_ANODA|nr:neuropeptide Y receptor [Anopheles darlingi]
MMVTHTVLRYSDYFTKSLLTVAGGGRNDTNGSLLFGLHPSNGTGNGAPVPGSSVGGGGVAVGGSIGAADLFGEVYAPNYPPPEPLGAAAAAAGPIGNRSSVVYGDYGGLGGGGGAPGTLAAECSNAYSAGLYFQLTSYFLYITIFVTAVIGNSIVLFIVQSNPRMRTVTNFFITNLAVGDLMMTLFCVPFTFISLFILQYWPFGLAMCRLVNYTQAVSVLVSAYTLVAISGDRYIAIMWPLRPRITKTCSKCLIGIVWIIALITAVPIALFSTLYFPTDWHVQCNVPICAEKWPSPEQDDYYTIALLTTQFVIPLVVLIFTYTRIAIVVWGKRPPGEAENSRDQRMAKSKRKNVWFVPSAKEHFTFIRDFFFNGFNGA